MKPLQRELGTITFAASQQRTLELPRNYAYRAISLRLVANLTWTQTTAGVVKDSAPAQLIRNITIRANGRDVIKSNSMEYFHRSNCYEYGVRPRVTTIAATTAATAQSVEVCAVIPFEMWRSLKPIDTLLDSSGMATLDMLVDWGTGANIFGGNYVGTVTVNSATLYVASIESVGVPPGTKFITHKEYAIESLISAATTRYQINLPVSNLYRGFWLKTVSDDVNVNTILNNIQLKSGTEVYVNRLAPFLQADNRVDYNMEVPNSTGTAPAEVANRNLPGWYFVEFVRDGRLTESLNTQRLSSLEFILDVNHPGTTDRVTIYPVELILPPDVQGA
jgi:hypothetical protein